MRTQIFKIISLFTVICILSFIGCSDDSNPTTQRTDPSFLIGTWEDKERGITFIIENDFSFICNLSTIEPDGNPEGEDAMPAQVQGNIVFEGVRGLGPNDFLLDNLRPTDVDEDSPFFEGNELLEDLIRPFNPLLATLTPNANKTEFAFDSQNAADVMFFGNGPFRKQP